MMEKICLLLGHYSDTGSVFQKESSMEGSRESFFTDERDKEAAMSSTVSTSEIKSLPSKMKSNGDKPQRLVRTSSIEKIRRFNSYICTQHYYIVPALLAWLKSSHDVLHHSAEKTILHLRSMVLTTLVYKLAHLDCRSLSYTILVEPVQRISKYLNHLYVYYQVDMLFLKFLVGLTVLTLAVQLGFCIFVIFSTTVPYGMGFLLICLLYISIVHQKALFYFMSSRTNRCARNKLKVK